MGFFVQEKIPNHQLARYDAKGYLAKPNNTVRINTLDLIILAKQQGSNKC